MAVLDIRPEGERRGKELPNGAPDVQRRQPRAGRSHLHFRVHTLRVVH